MKAIAKAPWWHSLPPDLQHQAVIRDGQAAWPRKAAEGVLRSLAALQQKVLWAGAWVPLPRSFVIPMRCVYTWLRDPASRDEVADAMAWIRDFAWDRRDGAFRAREPVFYFAVSRAGHPVHRPWQRPPRRRIWLANWSANRAPRSTRN